MAVDAEVNQLVVPLGDGLNNILNAYQDLDAVGEEEDNGMVDDMGEDVIIPNNLNMQPPEVAHLMLGRVETYFFHVPEEHNLHSRFSKQGLELWEKYFAPNLLPKESHGGSNVLQIPAPTCLLLVNVAEFSSPENNVMEVVSPKRKRSG